MSVSANRAKSASAHRTSTRPRPKTGPTTHPDAQVDVHALTEVLLGRWAPLRRAARATAKRPELWTVPGEGMDQHRERILAGLRQLAQIGQVHRAFPVRLGGSDDPGGNLAGFEELVAADPSLQIKSGVQWGLFAAAILHLGTPAQQDRWLPGAMDLSVPGIFAMTETGHGSDVASIATTATYDPDSREFVIHTPYRGAWKDYLGNAALHGIAAVVFAQLITPTGSSDGAERGFENHGFENHGFENHGVHAFYVPIRDGSGFLPGIGGQDDGHKGGLNGIDNGSLHFNHVRIPRANLLARYGAVDDDGTYTSPIDSPGRRFFTMLSSLVQGRVSLDGAAINGAKIGLAIAVKYAGERRQFAATTGGEELVLLDYPTHQRRLIVPIAELYAAHFAHDRLLDVFHSVFSGAADTEDERQDLETTAAALKANSTWLALDVLQEAREACGGAGFLTKNRITSLRHDLDIYVTFEGDNTVLLQLVAKRLLTAYGKQFSGATAAAMARAVMERAADMALHRTPLRRAGQALADVGDPRRAVGHLRATETQRTLLTNRVQTMVETTAEALRHVKDADPQTAAAMYNAHQVELVELAQAHAELLTWEAFTGALRTIADPGTRQILTTLRDVHGLALIERHLDWYLLNGRLSVQRARTVTSYLDRLVTRIRPHAQDLVDAWGFEPEHLRAEIATGAEGVRQEEAREYRDAHPVG